MKDVEKMIILITGGFGVGKDTFADYLLEEFEKNKILAQKIRSYTTRPPRYPGEKTHIFATPGVYETTKNNTVAQTTIDNYHYWTTPDQFDKNKINIYVVDDIGVRDTVTADIDEVFIILITRPQHLITVNKQRQNRKKTETFKFEPDFEILNDGDLKSLKFAAQHIPVLLPYYGYNFF